MDMSYGSIGKSQNLLSTVCRLHCLDFVIKLVEDIEGLQIGEWQDLKSLLQYTLLIVRPDMDIN